MLYLSQKTMVRLDNVAISHFPLNRMMSLAGKRLACLIMDKYQYLLNKGNPVVVLFGSGNNGGGGLFAAHHLLNNPKFSGNLVLIPAWDINKKKHNKRFIQDLIHQLRNYLRMSMDFPANSVVIDALLGYTLSSEPYGKYKDMIKVSNRIAKNIVSLDVPSGLNTRTGSEFSNTINPEFILTLDVPKYGLENYLKRIYIADVGFSQSDYDSLKISYNRPVFPPEGIMKLSEL